MRPPQFLMLNVLEDIARELGGVGAWKQLDCTTHGTPGAAKKFSETEVMCRMAIARAADSGNTASVSIGPSVSASYAPLTAGGGEYVIHPPLGKRFDLSTWYSSSLAANQSFKVLYFV